MYTARTLLDAYRRRRKMSYRRLAHEIGVDAQVMRSYLIVGRKPHSRNEKIINKFVVDNLQTILSTVTPNKEGQHEART